MKGLYRRLLVSISVLFLVLFTGLGVVLGQFFSLFADNIDDVVQKAYLQFLVLVLIIAFILSFYIISRMLRQYARPIVNATEAAIRISTGDYLTRASITEPESINELSTAINEIAHDLHEMTIKSEMDKERLKTLVESMGSGLLMIGREGNINLVNAVFCETFGFNKNEIIEKVYVEIGLPIEVDGLIEHVFMTEQASEKQVRLIDGVTSSYVSIYGAPVIGTHGNWLGIVVVVHDITKLIRLEEVRKNFVANVSHELRTPITSIKGFTETLLAGAMEDSEVLKEFLEIIQKEGDRLHLLIDDLLALSAMEREGFLLELAPVNIAKVINDAIRTVSGKIEKKNMTIKLNVESDIQIEGDAIRLNQVIVNILSNAISYSKEHKTIAISLFEINDDIVIEVRDEGIGIAASELPRLFERFYRVDRARSRDSGGTGLGLAIVKHLVEAHAGTITVESKLGKGTTFKIYLPNKNIELT
ncbi:two-component system histidine kinase PnpS [Sporosarcina sp. FA9]|uniref:two-component system histidine kinase PnpS n=1 Tax=Sporosarcina sp. FA9 TaxID=3413030 RepID=UPI003F659B13